MGRVKIEYTGGSMYNVRVTDAETGEPIQHIKKIELVLEADVKPALAIIHVYNPLIYLETEAQTQEAEI